MQWLLHNPIADLPGPYFLALYVGIVLLLVVEAYWKVHRNDPTAGMDPPPVPSKPDPYEIAILRGGENELTRLVIFDLIRRGYLETNSQGKGSAIQQASGPVAAEPLTELERRVYEYFSKSRTTSSGIFGPGSLSSRIKPYTSHLEDALRQEELLTSHDRKRRALRTWLSGTVFILALGGYKFAVALEKGRHNVAFLIILGIVGLIALSVTCVAPRLTRRGRDYLAQLQDAFAGVKTSTGIESHCGPTDPVLLLAVSVFGISILSGTPYTDMTSLFPQAASHSGGGCGGGGCGGGCGGGGCGGGGCGGCGS